MLYSEKKMKNYVLIFKLEESTCKKNSQEYALPSKIYYISLFSNLEGKCTVLFIYLHHNSINKTSRFSFLWSRQCYVRFIIAYILLYSNFNFLHTLQLRSNYFFCLKSMYDIAPICNSI